MKSTITILFAIILFITTGCSKDDKSPKYKINSEALSTNYNKEFQFTIEGNPENIEWSSSDENVGTIDDTGLFKASKIGKTTIIGKIGNASVKSEVTVDTYGEIFKEPYMEYDATPALIKGKESRSLLGENATSLLYKGENPLVDNVIYQFEGAKLKNSFIAFGVKDKVVESVAQFYQERYNYLGSTENIIIFENGISTIGVTIDADFGLVAIYLKSTSLQALSNKQAIIHKNIDLSTFKNVLK